MSDFTDWFGDSFGDLWGGFTGGDADGFWGGLGNLLGGSTSGNNMIDALFGLGIGSLLQGSGFGDPQIPQAGYQGKIPEYAAVRERVPMQNDPNRRPGAGGQRYFSDMIFADAPERQPISVEEAKAKAQQQAQGLASIMPSYSAPTKQESKHFVSSTPASDVINSMPVEDFEDEDAIDTGGFTGGVMNAGGRYLSGTTDGMEDRVAGNVGSNDEVRLSHGEFVIPADVVSHLGNGNSDAGADQLHNFMRSIRKERTGNPKQGKQINPNKFLKKV
jgi:hypothetical protein